MIFVDGEHVCRCSSLPMALALYAICFYVFNLSFLDNSIKTVLFQQKFAFRLNDPSRNSHAMRIYRACDAVIDKLSKEKPAEAHSRKRNRATCNKTHPGSGRAKPCIPVASASTCSGGVDDDSADGSRGSGKAKPRIPVASASLSQIKRARKLPKRLRE